MHNYNCHYARYLHGIAQRFLHFTHRSGVHHLMDRARERSLQTYMSDAVARNDVNSAMMFLERGVDVNMRVGQSVNVSFKLDALE